MVNFDNDLWVNSSTARYAYVQDIFGFGYQAPVEAAGVSFSTAGHYVTERHAAGESISTENMTPAGVTAPAAVTVLATMGSDQPFLAVTTFGAGRAVQWGTYAWMSHAVKGPLFGPGRSRVAQHRLGRPQAVCDAGAAAFRHHADG